MPSKLCFVIGPIGARGSDTRTHADRLLKSIVRPVIAKRPDFKTERADLLSEPGLITVMMIRRLLTADLVIADLSTHNPNAFYEIGIRHMVQKPIIHMIKEGEKIPFDVSPYSTILFSLETARELKRARTSLAHSVEEVLKPGHKVETPVTSVREIHPTVLPIEQASERILKFAMWRRVELEEVKLGERSSSGVQSYKAEAKDKKGAVYCHASGSRIGEVYYVRKGIAHYYFRHAGGPASALGLPISNEEIIDPTGFPTTFFEGGFIDWSPETGKARAILVESGEQRQLGIPAVL
jgi:hypothetical protein